MSLVLDIVCAWQRGQSEMRRRKYCEYMNSFVMSTSHDIPLMNLWFCFVTEKAYFNYLKALSEHLLSKFGYPLPYQRRYRKKWPQLVDAVVAWKSLHDDEVSFKTESFKKFQSFFWSACALETPLELKRWYFLSYFNVSKRSPGPVRSCSFCPSTQFAIVLPQPPWKIGSCAHVGSAPRRVYIANLPCTLICPSKK